MRIPFIIHTEKDGALAPDSANSCDDVMRAISALPAGGRVVLHFHGGLNSRADGIAVANALDPVYRAAVPGGADVVPVFFVWESGFAEVMSRYWPRIAEDVFFQALRHRVLSIAGGRLMDAAGGKSAVATVLPDALVATEVATPTRVSAERPDEPFSRLGRPNDLAPLSATEQADLEGALQSDPELVRILEGIAAQQMAPGAKSAAVATPTALPQDRIDQIARDSQGAAGSRGISGFSILKDAAMVVARVIMRFVKHRDHGLYPTVIEEIAREFYLADFGVGVWGEMKRQTQSTFSGDQPPRGGYLFVNALNKLANLKDLRITLVGHSAGAVFINNLLRHVQSGRLANPAAGGEYVVENVVFLAPACTVVEFEEIARAPYFDTATGATRLYGNFRMFTMTDEHESRDVLVPGLYPRSLLYLISGVLESDETGASAADVPVLGMQRFYTSPAFSADPHVSSVMSFLGVNTPTSIRVAWSTSAGTPGWETGSLEHGGFWHDPSTQRSLQHIIAQGC